MEVYLLLSVRVKINVWPANGQSYTTAQSGVTFVDGCNIATLNLTINLLQQQEVS